MKATATKTAPIVRATRAARPRTRKKMLTGAEQIKRIREIAVAVGGFDEVELPERFKLRAELPENRN